GEPLGRVGPLRAEDAPLDVFPKLLTQAVLSVEDRRFYDHFGIDPLGILRAAYANRAAGEIVEGGSTITQQLVKLEYLNNDRTYARKLREAVACVMAGSPPRQGGDPHPLSEPRLPGRRRLWHDGRRPALFRQTARRPDIGRSSDAGGLDPSSIGLDPLTSPRGCPDARRDRS